MKSICSKSSPARTHYQLYDEVLEQMTVDKLTYASTVSKPPVAELTIKIQAASLQNHFDLSLTIS